MEQKFEGKSAVEYFLQYSKESIEICYEYFKTLKVSDEKKQKLFCIEKEMPSFEEKLLFVYTSLDAYYQSNIFIMSEPTLVDDEAIVAKSVSPIPSVQLTGNLILLPQNF